jgi:dTDP-4-amino-4,6-dideoxygalactose transaminase
LINDNCHALGSEFNKDKGYAVKFADFVSLSFHPVKAITTGEGGAILTNNLNFDKKAKILRSHGILKKKNEHWKYSIETLGYNFRLPDINCALGISQIKKLNKFIKKREKISKIYNNFFSNTAKFFIPQKINNNKNSFHLYPLLLNLKTIGKTKDQIIKEFLKYKIKIQVHYIPVNTQPYYKKKYGFKKKNFQNSLEFYKNCISLPIYYDLNSQQLNYIKKICKQIFRI